MHDVGTCHKKRFDSQKGLGAQEPPPTRQHITVSCVCNGISNNSTSPSSPRFPVRIRDEFERLVPVPKVELDEGRFVLCQREVLQKPAMSRSHVILTLGAIVDVSVALGRQEEHRLDRPGQVIQEDGRVEDEFIVVLVVAPHLVVRLAVGARVVIALPHHLVEVRGAVRAWPLVVVEVAPGRVAPVRRAARDTVLGDASWLAHAL
mmetsp:Transcript_3397/g.7637  ORF Transcript_3397/g.7637 Transcript_3397/m.7637 type:complete len:205 (-) Transcript_3397:41-655(-)